MEWTTQEALRYIQCTIYRSRLCVREDRELKEGKIPQGMELSIQVSGKPTEQRETSGSLQFSLWSKAVKSVLQYQNPSTWETAIGRLSSTCAFSKWLGANFTRGQLCDIQVLPLSLAKQIRVDGGGGH